MPTTGGLTLLPAPGAAPLAVVLPAGVRGERAVGGLGWEAYAGPGGGVVVVARANADADYVAHARPPASSSVAPVFALARVSADGRTGSFAPLAGGGAPAPLHPVLTRLSYAPTASGPDAGTSAPPTPADAAAARAAGKRALVEQYGSAKARRRLAAADRGGVDAAAAGDGAAGVAGLLAGAAVAAGGGGSRDAVLAAVAAARPALPPHVPTATTPHAAYPLDGLVPPGGLAALDAWADELAAIKREGRVEAALAAGEEAAAAAAAAAAAPKPDPDGAAPQTADDPAPPTIHFPPHILHRLAGLPADVDSDAGRRRARALALLAAALRLATAPRTLRTDGGGLAPLAARLQIPPPLLAALLDRYADAVPAGKGTAYARTGARAVAIRALAAVAAVLAADGDLAPPDFAGLRAALAGSAKELALLCREAGCVATAAGVEGGHRAYRVRLLSGGGAKTLEESFPKLKVGRKTK